jgi:hypothetical protein
MRPVVGAHAGHAAKVDRAEWVASGRSEKRRGNSRLLRFRLKQKQAEKGRREKRKRKGFYLLKSFQTNEF